MSKSRIAKFGLGLIAAVLMLATAVTANAETFAFSKSLSMGQRDAQVMDLQKFLNMSADTMVASTGAGSPGMETSYFGPATKSAVLKFQLKNGVVASATSAGAGRFGPATRAKALAVQAGTTTGGTQTVPLCPNGMTLASNCTMAPNGGAQTGPVTAMLATNTPASGTFVAGQATANLANFTFSGNGVVTGVTLQRIGVSADATLSNVYLFDGSTRLTDAASVTNNGAITFNNPAGLFTVSGTKTISVRSDILAGSAGQTVGITLAGFSTSAGTVSVNISGNISSIATATLATVTAVTVTPSGATINPGANQTLWQSTLNISQRDVWMKRFAVRQVGSAPASSFANFKLYVNGVQVSTAAAIDSMGYVTFDMSTAPVMLQSGSRIVRIDADVVSGASRTVSFSVRQAADVDFIDSSYGVNITPTSTPWAGSSVSTIGGTSGGSMTIEKDVSSPTQPVTLGANNVKLGTFKATAYGEAIKIETLRVSYEASDTNIGSLRNGKVFINGVQYGSSTTLNEDGQATPYTSYTVNYTVYPGTPVMIDVYADIYDNDGTDSITSGETIRVELAAGSSNASKLDSLGYINAPGAEVTANTITMSSATATLAKNPTYANQTVAIPQTSGYKIGSWNMTGSSVEDILLSTLSFDVDEVTVSADDFNELDLTNLTVVVKDANGNTVASPSPLGTVSATDNNFSISYTLMKNTAVSIELWATIGSTITNAEKMKTDLTVTGTAMVSGSAVSNADVDGQTITAGTGSLTITRDASSPDARIVADNQTIDVATYNFEALYAGYNVTDITFTIADATNVSNVMLYDGATLVASKAGAATVTFNGLNWNVQAGSSKDLTVKLQLGTVGVGAGSTGASLLTTLTAATATSTATGVSAAATESNPASNAHYVYAAIPTITNVALPTSVLSTGTVTAAKFSVGSNGTGTIAWSKIIFTITRAMGGTDTLASATLWDADTNTQISGTPTFGGSVEADGGTSGTLAFVADAEQQISGSKTYVLKMVTAGTFVSGDNLNVSIAQPSSFAASNTYATVAATSASFVWSDISAASHSATTSDWNNGFLVKNLPTDSQTLSKN